MAERLTRPDWVRRLNLMAGSIGGRARDLVPIDADGRFTAVISHTDPGTPNWLDTEGRPFGIVFWRFMLSQGDIDTPQAQLVPLEDLPKHI